MTFRRTIPAPAGAWRIDFYLVREKGTCHNARQGQRKRKVKESGVDTTVIDASQGRLN